MAASILTPFRDAWLAARARLALLAATGVAGSAIAVDVHHGRVVLSGRVPDEAIGRDAADAVRALPGVVGVANQTQAAESPRRAAVSDDELRTAIAERLRATPALRRSRIYVHAVYDGRVTLAGTARNHAAQLVAFEATLHVPGVRRVVDDVAIAAQLSATADAA